MDRNSETSRKIEALDELLDFIEDIDIARDFLVVGGLIPLLEGSE